MPPADVVIVAIDEQSSGDLGLPEHPRGWPRSLHAELARYLKFAGARVVVFDLTFDAPGTLPAHDQLFADALRSAGNVLLAESIRRDTVRLQAGDGTANGSAIIERRNRPLAIIGDAAAGSAPFMLPKDARVDTYWTFLDEGRTTPTLPVLSFRVFAESATTSPADASGFQRIERDLLASPESQYLNYYGPPRAIRTVSYSDVIKAARGTGPAATDKEALFAGKAVFVGFAAATPGGQDRLRDDYRTVFSQANGLDLSGVEIAATAFANLVDGRILRSSSLGTQLSIVVIAGLLLGVVCRLVRPIFAAIVVFMLAAAYLFLVQQRFTGASLWLPSIVPVGVQAPLALFAGVWLNYRDTKTERETIRRAFGLFLPKGVVEQLTRGLGSVTNANRVLFGACLSTDAEQYTALSERMDPNRLGEFMNAYYARLFVPVERHGGVVADVVGDSMVAVWAKAAENVDVRLSACRAALEIAGALESFSSGDDRRQSLPTRFGLHSGEMLFGSIGASGHYEYRAVGDIVNTASRIQGLNKVLGTRILASEETVRGLDVLAIRPLGSFLLAGKTNAVSVIELLGERSALGASGQGRCEEFALALEAFTRANWHDAGTRFERLLLADPHDGPARFYAGQCRGLNDAPPSGDWSSTIRITSK